MGDTTELQNPDCNQIRLGVTIGSDPGLGNATTFTSTASKAFCPSKLKSPDLALTTIDLILEVIAIDSAFFKEESSCQPRPL